MGRMHFHKMVYQRAARSNWPRARNLLSKLNPAVEISDREDEMENDRIQLALRRGP